MMFICLVGNNHDWLFLNKDCTDMLSGNRVSGEFINNIDL